MKSFTIILSLLALALPTTFAQQTAFQVDCDTSDVTTPSVSFNDWVNSLLTVLHDNAKFSFEQLVVALAATEDGFDMLEQVWESTAPGGDGETWSLLVPTDEALASSGLKTPYSSLDETILSSLFAYHTLPESLSSSASPSEIILETLFPVYNGQEGVLVGTASGDSIKVSSPVNATIKLDSLDEGAQASNLNTFKLYEVNAVITAAPTLRQVLSTYATSTSTSAKKSGLALYAAALNVSKTLDTLSGFATAGGKGLTILAPVDDAFNANMTSDSVAGWTKVLAGHYSSSQTLYSTQFGNASVKLNTANGNTVHFTTNSSGTWAISSDGVSSAKVLRTDILLSGGGVLHVVDTLLSSQSLSTTKGTSGNGTTIGVTTGAASRTQIGAMGSLFVFALAIFGVAF